MSSLWSLEKPFRYSSTWFSQGLTSRKIREGLQPWLSLAASWMETLGFHHCFIWLIPTHTVVLPWWLRWERICLQCGRLRFNPWVGKIPWRRECLPTPVLLPRKFYGQKSLADCSPWAHKELDTVVLRHTHTHNTLTISLSGGRLFSWWSQGILLRTWASSMCTRHTAKHSVREWPRCLPWGDVWVGWKRAMT